MISTSAASTRWPASPIATTTSSSPTSSPRTNPRPRSTFKKAPSPPVGERVGVRGITAHSFAQRPSPSQRYALGPSLSRDAAEGVLSVRQLPHAAVDTIERQREHALFHQLADHADAGRAAPILLRHRVEPHRPRIGVEQTAQPGFARLVIPALDAAALLLDLVGAHAVVADQHDLVAGIVGAQDFHHVDLFDMPSP